MRSADSSGLEPVGSSSGVRGRSLRNARKAWELHQLYPLSVFRVEFK